MVWKPHVTVAAIAELDGRFLVVEERVRGQVVINNPAGHLEESESFQDAIRREMLEETGWEFEPDRLTGIYLWKNRRLDTTFLRVTFFGHCIRHHPERPLDRGIIGPKWLTRDELESGQHALRSPMVMRCIDDYLAGCRYPLELLTCFPRFEASLDDA
ncbi:MAG TPA: NUDIX hydrolase [Gammaproteobacteria bacterium]